MWKCLRHHHHQGKLFTPDILEAQSYCVTTALLWVSFLFLYTFRKTYFHIIQAQIRGCIQTFPDWPPEAETANGTALCHYVQSYRYFVSQSREFCRHNPLCCFSTSVYCCCCLFRNGLSPETFGYTFVYLQVFITLLLCVI
jgi:hypothetical protein